MLFKKMFSSCCRLNVGTRSRPIKTVSFSLTKKKKLDLKKILHYMKKKNRQMDKAL